MKYKKLYEESQEKLASCQYWLEKEKKNNQALDKENEKLQEILRASEGRESDVRRENEWLKTTIRLMVVDADKIAGLAKELEYNNLSLSYKL